MLTALAIFLVLVTLAYVLLPRQAGMVPGPASGTLKLSEHRNKEAFENLRDLRFEYELGKLSYQDYLTAVQALEAELQTSGVPTSSEPSASAQELAGVKEGAPGHPREPATPAPTACPHCGARFSEKLKFCGECGRPLPGGPLS